MQHSYRTLYFSILKRKDLKSQICVWTDISMTRTFAIRCKGEVHDKKSVCSAIFPLQCAIKWAKPDAHDLKFHFFWVFILIRISIWSCHVHQKARVRINLICTMIRLQNFDYALGHIKVNIVSLVLDLWKESKIE